MRPIRTRARLRGERSRVLDRDARTCRELLDDPHVAVIVVPIARRERERPDGAPARHERGNDGGTDTHPLENAQILTGGCGSSR
jgi:5-methylcytosine-specific restriction endonuclease McrA